MIIKFNYKFITVILSLCLVILFISSEFIAKTPVGASGEIHLPIIMYHHISADEKALNDYVISPTELESDFSMIKKLGYTAILPAQLIDYTEKGVPLPGNPIMITFDDGFESVYHYAYPLAEKYGLKFTVAIYGKETERFSECNDHNILYSYMTRDEIKELSESGICEIANHTYSLHGMSERKGRKKNKNEDVSSYEKVVSEDLMHLQRVLSELDISPLAFVYPYGFFCKHSECLIEKLGFKVSFICTEGVNRITQNPDCLYNLKRYNRPHGISTEYFFNKLK